MPQDQPLGLTVHSMPTVEQASVARQRRTASGRLRMFAVLLICAAPVVASYFTYYVVRPHGRPSYGVLIEPQRPLPALLGQPVGESDAAPVDLRSLHGQWLLINVSGGACDASCERHLYLQRQLRESLGRDKDRMDRVWLVDDAAPVRPEIARALQGGTVLRVPAAALATWLAPASGRKLQDHLYLVDPLGNWMMRFPPDSSTEAAARVKRDIERLLRASASWDTAGRP